ncbi:MAG: SpaH/EbpB family LPXTG-anchored major pilin [Clostridiales bacterium]|nr:SpaH/EbpB family LPXTG-anchored major pilin [Clostridiales bacterium]
MLKSKKLKRVFSIVITSVFCMIAFAQTLYAADEYALNGTISSLKTIVEDQVPWTSSDDSGQIDIKLRPGNTGDGSIFTAYKLLDIDNQGGWLKVSIPDGAKAFWNDYTGKPSATVNDIKEALTGDAEAQSSDIITAFVPFASKPDPVDSAPADNGKTKITTDFGFYAILQTKAPADGHIASAPVLACLPMKDPVSSTWLKQFTIEPKDDKISVKKRVHASDEGDFKDETITNINDTVTYEIIAELPEYGTDIVNGNITYSLEDKLPYGVTIDVGTLNVTIKGKGRDTFVDTTLASASYNKTERKITLTVDNYGDEINGKYDEIKITYNAVLNKDAAIEGSGNVNNVTLKYSAYKGETEPAEAKADAKVYTMGLDIKKIDKTSREALAGAEFEVYTDADGTNKLSFIETVVDGIQSYRVATQADIDEGVATTTTIKVTNTDANKGILKLNGLNDATYYLKETKAPTGYNLSDNLVEVEVKPDDKLDYNDDHTLNFDGNRLLKEITNSTGIDLPVTGGMGTVIFTVIGLLLMAGAAYFLFFSRKKNAE